MGSTQSRISQVLCNTSLVLRLQLGNSDYALKIALVPEENNTLKQEETKIREINSIDHKHTAIFHQSYTINLGDECHDKCCNDRVALLFDHGGPTLLECLIEPKEAVITSEFFQKIVEEGAQFLQNLAINNYVLGDIKPENVLWDPHTKKLSFVDAGEAGKVDDPNRQPFYRTTRWYRCPSIVTEKRSLAEGPFSWAAVLYEIVTKQPLFLTPVNEDTEKDEIYNLRVHLSQVFLFIPPTQQFIDSIPDEIRKDLFNEPATPTSFKTIYPLGCPTTPDRFQKKYMNQLQNAVSSNRFPIENPNFIPAFDQFLRRYLDYNNPPKTGEELRSPFQERVSAVA